MLPPSFALPFGIYCIDTLQERPGMACCYVLERQGELAVIEAGTNPGVPGLMAWLASRGYAPEAVRYVVLTHIHLDHAGGAGALMAQLPKAHLVVHARGARHMVDPSRLIEGATAVYGAEAIARMYGAIVPVAAERVISPSDGSRLPLGDGELEFIDSPGHARHHFSIWDATSQGFFTGDTFGLSYREFDSPQGAWIMPTTTPVQFEPEAWHATLARYLSYQPQRMFLTHFGMIEDIPRHAAALARGIDRYVNLAQQYAATPNRHTVLLEALLADALTDLQRHGSPLAPTLAQQLLATDLELNAQGLAIWLDKHNA